MILLQIYLKKYYHCPKYRQGYYWIKRTELKHCMLTEDKMDEINARHEHLPGQFLRHFAEKTGF
jgi:hypothetical protein